MKIIEDVLNSKELIESCISKYGTSPEHNFRYYLNIEETGAKNVFISFGKDKGIIAQRFANEWIMVGEVLAPEDERVELLFEAIGSVSEKFVVEASESFRKKLIERAGKNFVMTEPRFVLYWPVFDFSKWNGDKLEGGDWKKLRNIRNQFLKRNKVEVLDSVSIPKEKLAALVMDWVAERRHTGLEVDRRSNNKAFYDRYLNMIKDGFAGMKLAKSVVVNGEPCSITAGWEIPNSNHDYYSAVGLYSYKYEGLGEFANMEDLALLKGMGYRTVDFGGSPKSLLEFKMKFKPTEVYKTYTFSIQKNQFKEH